MTSSHPSSLGEFLRNERENRGLTVEQVASATKISLRLLHALENDLYEELPAKPFVRGFVIAYCRFLGVDPQETLTRFSRFLDDRSAARPSKDAGHSGYAFERKEGDQSRAGLWMLMGMLALVAVVVVLIAKPSLKSHRRGHVERLREAQQGVEPVPSSGPSVAPSPAPSIAPSAVPSPAASPSAVPAVRVSPSPTPSPSRSPSPGSSPSPSPSAGPSRRPDPLLSGKDLFKEEIRVRVVIQANQDMWVKFKVDDRAKNRIVLRQGITLVLLGRESVAIQSSNPGDALVTRQAGEPNALKSLGAVQNLADLLKSGAGVTEDGRSLWVPAQVSGTQGNPFAGEAPMSPPPPKPASGASNDAPQSP